MEDLISRQHFDERVRLAGGMADEELTQDFKDGVLIVLEMLKTEPPVNPNTWIPVSERLPEDNLKVFVSTKTAIGIAAHNELGWYTPDTYFDGVIAWMPLPEPWKGKE